MAPAASWRPVAAAGQGQGHGRRTYIHPLGSIGGAVAGNVVAGHVALHDMVHAMVKPWWPAWLMARGRERYLCANCGWQ